jgi:uncharacterized membrane protein HdeD (DUF308 family)
MSFPVAAVITIIIFIGVAFLIKGIARIVEGFSGKPLIFNILYLMQYLLLNHKENKHEPSKQSSENYHANKTSNKNS